MEIKEFVDGGTKSLSLLDTNKVVCLCITVTYFNQDSSSTNPTYKGIRKQSSNKKLACGSAISKIISKHTLDGTLVHTV